MTDKEMWGFENIAEPVHGIQTRNGVLMTHPATECVGRACVVHNPSDHKMKNWTLNWRGDRRIMERLCPAHGVGHPDPDDAAYRASIGDDDTVHGCCGCCHD